MTVGEIRASVTLENIGDRENVYRGHCVEADVRRTTVEGVVDTGAVSLVIPEEIATELGLRHRGTRTVVYADERRERPPGDKGHDRDREPRDGHRGHHRSGREPSPDRAGRARNARPHRRLQQPDAGAAPSGRASPRPARSAKDSDRYKVANCTQPQPVFYCFPRLARGKVIAVTVLSPTRARPQRSGPGRLRPADPAPESAGSSRRSTKRSHSNTRHVRRVADSSNHDGACPRPKEPFGRTGRVAVATVIAHGELLEGRHHRRAQRPERSLHLDEDRRRDPGEHRSVRAAHGQAATSSLTSAMNH